MITIPFNKPYMTGKELDYIAKANANCHLSGDGEFTRKCHAWLAACTGTRKALLTHSCTAALEMSAILSDIQQGDEVIMPSYTFVSTANAFVLRGARIAFVDIRPDTMNINEQLIEEAINSKTKAIVPVHYAGVSCEMDAILALSEKYNLMVIEDSAQGLMSRYKGRPLGSMGDFGCFSFHETKNCQCGEGGAITLNREKFIERAEIIREKGTNRSKFFRGEVDKYSWVDIGSSYLPSELSSAFLYAQLEMAGEITDNRLKKWRLYNECLKPLSDKGLIELPHIPQECEHNGHIFYLKAAGQDERDRLIKHLEANGINAIFHYVPLHSSAAGQRLGYFHGADIYTTKESERLLRLPIYPELKDAEIVLIAKKINEFYGC